MRYYLGVDWADQMHAVWVVDEQGTKVGMRTVPHTAEGLSEWGRELDEWRARGIELWAAIERPRAGWLISCSTMASWSIPSIPRRWTGPGIDSGRVRPRVIRLTRGCWPTFCARITRTCAPCSRARKPPRSSNCSRTTTSADSAADAPGQPADDNAEGVLSAGSGGRRVDDGPGPGVPAGLSDAGRLDRADGTPVAAVGAGPPAERGPDTGAVGRAAAAQLPVPAHVVRAKARLMQSLVAQLTLVMEVVGAYREAIEDFFAQIPAAQWIRTLPIGDHGITAPTLWARLGDAPGRWESFRHLQAQAGTVPVTIRSGSNRSSGSASPATSPCATASTTWRSSPYAGAMGPSLRRRAARAGSLYRQALRALSAKWPKIIL